MSHGFELRQKPFRACPLPIEQMANWIELKRACVRVHQMRCRTWGKFLDLMVHT